MRKIARQYENPLDNFNIDFVDGMCPLFKKLGMTPNYITTLSLIFGLISLYFLWTYSLIPFAVCYYISYLFDCMDGHYARRYKMVSKGGDMYDHVKDVTVNILLIFVLIYRYPVSDNRIKILVIILALVFFVLMCAHLGCQDRVYVKEESDTLNACKKLCVGNPRINIQFTRFFGCGTFIVMVICLVFLLNSYRLTGG